MGLFAGTGSSQEDDRKPIIRQMMNTIKRNKGRKPSEKDMLVVSIRESQSLEWLIVETNVCVGLISGDSKVAELLIDDIDDRWRQSDEGKVSLPAWTMTYAPKLKCGFDLEWSKQFVSEMSWENDVDEPMKVHFDPTQIDPLETRDTGNDPKKQRSKGNKKTASEAPSSPKKAE